MIAIWILRPNLANMRVHWGHDVWNCPPWTHRAGNLCSRATFFADIASNTSNWELRCHWLPIFEYSVLQSPLLAEELSLSLSKSQQQRSSVSGEKDSRQVEFFPVVLISGFRQVQLELFQQIITSLPLLCLLTKTHLKCFLPWHSKWYFKNSQEQLAKKSVYGCSSNCKRLKHGMQFRPRKSVI